MKRLLSSTWMRAAAAVAVLVGIGVVAHRAEATGTLLTQLQLRFFSTGYLGVGLTTVDNPVTEDYTQLLSTGTGANQASNIFHDRRTIAASSSENLDLYGSLTNAFGVTLNFSKIKALIVHAASTNTNNVLLGGAGSNTFINWVGDPTDVIVVRPGGTFVLVAPDATGYGVTSGTGDLLKVANSGSGTSIQYDVMVIGVD